MKKRIFSPLFALVTLFVMLALVLPVSAAPMRQTGEVDSDMFTLAQIGEQEIQMFGPFQTRTILFGIPSNWQLLAGAQLELDMRVAVHNLIVQTDGVVPTTYGGTLTVVLNRKTLAVLPLADSGQRTETVPIPPDALNVVRDDGRMELVLVLSGGEACLADQQVNVLINSSSRFTLPHNLVPPDTNLVNFPSPLYQDSIFPDSATIVVPDDPSAGELQSALTVAAGLQARTGERMILDMATNSELTEAQKTDNHIILVGKTGSLPVYSQLTLPLDVSKQSSESGNNGIVEMVASPWSQKRVVLIVSGNSDEDIIKAAQALSTSVIRPNRAPNLALIEEVQSKSYRSSTPIDQTLADLGYPNATFEGRGETFETYQFYIPPGQTVTTEAFFEASISHSALLNYDQSGVFFSLNDEPIGSIRLNDTTANQANNRIRIAIPPSAVQSGINNLDVSALLEPLDQCADPDQTGLFVTLWSESRLFLPLGQITANPNNLPDLANYPSPFTQSPSLGKTAFVLEKGNPDSWRSAMKIAANAGAIANGAVMNPVVFFADAVPEEELPNYDFLIVGTPSKLPILSELNDFLPGPFAEGSNVADENYLQVIYQVAPQMPVGYLEVFSSPWNSDNVVLTALGNSSQGINWSSDALVVDDIRQKLAGDFAVINAQQTLSTDTRVAKNQATDFLPAPLPSPEPGSEGSGLSRPTARPPWVLTALIATVVLIVAVIIIALFSSWVRNRSKKQKGDSE